MILRLLKPKRKYIIIDVSTQKDFFLAKSTGCINNHRRILANIRRIIAWARARHIPIISTCQVYSKNGENGNNHLCVDGTDGQKKIHYTLLNNRVNFAADDSTDLPRDLFRKYKQVILHQRCPDPFEEPRIERLLSELHNVEFILIGAYTENAVEATALGLLQRGKRLTVVIDAIGSNDRKQADMTLRKIKAKGAKLTETKRLAGSSHLRGVGICDCPLCSTKPRKVNFTASV